MRQLLILFLFLAAFQTGSAQEKAMPVMVDTLKFYWVEFTDKDSTPYSIDKPEAFLSEKALERRQKYGIAITEDDFPPNPDYVRALRAKKAKVMHTSRWLNAATITILEDSLEALKQLDFISTVQYVGIQTRGGSSPTRELNMDSLQTIPRPQSKYGYGAEQIMQINGHVLHQIGLTGKGVTVAVLDGGFTGVDQSPFFEDLRKSGRLLPGIDFVDIDNSVYESNSHGTRVLSCMAANVPKLMVGTAPDASYVCIKTEDVRNEYPLEECHWVAGIEFADSIGADIVTSSLGYTEFDDTLLHHTHLELDGKTAISSRAAAYAAQKGMLVLNSAGNSGNDEWRKIGFPADVASTLTVGATTLKGELASFSSVGPTADGRIKPDIIAPGARVALADAYSYKVSKGSGTSFSTPIIAGMVACLMEGFPDKTNAEIIKAIKVSSSLANEPNAEKGYGIPNFQKAYSILKLKSAEIKLVPKPATSGNKDE
jgi:serine protease AprX